MVVDPAQSWSCCVEMKRIKSNEALGVDELWRIVLNGSKRDVEGAIVSAFVEAYKQTEGRIGDMEAKRSVISPFRKARGGRGR